jgi:hypothetical protein
MKRVIFHTVYTSERHRTMGTCDSGDFGKIDLIQLDKEDKELMVSFRKYSDEPKTEYIEHEGYAYKNFGGKIAHLSQEEEEKWSGKQGKFTPKTAIELMLIFRESKRRTFAHADDSSYILIGRTLYERYCKTEDLSITVCGNTMFSHWISIGIESHGGKVEYPLSKSKFKEIYKDRKQSFEDTRPDKHFSGRADTHSHFSYPQQIKWGAKYNK